MRPLVCSLSVGIWLAACGGDAENLSGIYKVDAMSTDAQGCGPGMPDTSYPPYIELKQDLLLGTSIHTFAACQSADVATCQGFFGLPIYEVQSDGGIGYVSSSASGGACTLQYTEATFTVLGTALRHEQHTYRDNNASGAPCTQDEAKRRGAAMPCVNYQLTLATRVSP
jgi:hypothetical protein